jgi:CubicO group peptidase (beta-lactamase class C family)
MRAYHLRQYIGFSLIAPAVTALILAAPPQQAPSPAGSAAARRPAPVPSALDPARVAQIDGLVAEAIRARQLPGAVVLIGRGDANLFVKAYGNRALEPAVEPMTVDTVFDMASVTKVVATTTSVMMLVEEGRIRLNDRVATFIPGFARYGKGDITIRHLMTHVSGLREDIDV